MPKNTKPARRNKDKKTKPVKPLNDPRIMTASKKNNKKC